MKRLLPVLMLLPAAAFAETPEELAKMRQPGKAIKALQALEMPEEQKASFRLYLDALYQLKSTVIKAVSAGEHPPFSARFMGQRIRGKVVECDDENLTLDLSVTKEQRAWKDLTTAEVVRLAESAAGDEKGVIVACYRVAAAEGDDKTRDRLMEKVNAEYGDLLAELRKQVSAAPGGAAAADAGEGGAGMAATEAGENVEDASAKFVVITPEEDTERALKLPDAGLQSRMWSGPRANHVPRANILYARFTWKDWGRLGEKRISHYKGWMAQKRYISLRMYCNRPEDLPEGLDVPIAQDGGTRIPKYWSPEFIAAHREWCMAVGKELAADPYLTYVDIGGVGNTGGEWIIRGNYDDFTPDAKDHMTWETIKMYREAFPHVRLYLAAECPRRYVKDLNALYDYCKKNNIGFRLDGLCGVTGSTNDWARRAGIADLWKNHPYQWEGAYATMEWERTNASWNTATVMENAMTYGPLSICYADADADAVRFENDETKRAILDKAALRLGYRFVIEKAAYRDAMRRGTTWSMQMVVANRGCAYCYADRDMELAFLNSAGQPLWALKAKPFPPTSQWAPDQQIQVLLRVMVPKGAPSGRYALTIAMMDEDPRRPDNRIDMAMKQKTPENRFILGGIIVR